ncbi:hypothetical protein HY572_03540 [Candidatus Micrarchaeota archaeon]|nr:hypothetical protein [Candidatus Micrarchaeota archaeon]
MRRAFCFWVFLAMLWPQAAAVSSNEALETLGDCLRESNPQLKPLTQPFFLDSVGYWAFYYPLGHSRKMVVAVGQDDGVLVQDRDRLERLSAGLYNHLVLKDYVDATGWSAEKLEATSDASLNVIDDQYSKLQVFQNQVQPKYPDLNLQSVEFTLDSLRGQAEAFHAQLQNTASEQQFYDGTWSAEGSGFLLDQYNASFTAMFKTFDVYDGYTATITAVQTQVYEQSIPDPDNKNINTNLDNLRNAGLANVYAKAKAADPRKAVASYLSQRDQWVEDAVSSFEFQDLSCRANAAYKNALTEYQQIQRGERNIQAAGFSSDVQRVKNEWAKFETAYNQRNADGYQYVLDNAPSLQTSMTDLRDRYQKSLEPTPQPAPKSTGPDASTILIVVVVLALAAYGYNQYKKQKEEQDGGATGDSGH